MYTKPQSIRMVAVAVTLAIAAFAPQASAQRPLGTEADLLRNSEVLDEIGVTDDQKTKLQELQKPFDFNAYREAQAAAKTQEEKDKLREEMTAQVQNSRTKFKENALAVLNDEQRKKIRGIYLTTNQVRGLADETIAAEYGLTEEQTEQIAKLSQDRRSAFRNMSRQATDEERDELEAEWRSKLLAVLTDEQKARFSKELAQAPGQEEQATAQTPSAGGSGSTESGGSGRPSTDPPDGEEATASFGGEAGSEQLVDEFSFNFRFAPWDQVLQMFADGTGLTLDLNDVPPGTFSHLDNNKYSAKEALDIINGYLLRKGYGMFEKEGFLIVLNLDNGIPPSLLRDVKLEELLSVDPVQVGNNELVNVTLEVGDLDTAKAAQEIEALIGPWGSMIALTESHLLIVTDIGSNLRRINTVLVLAMAKSKPDALVFKRYAIVHMDVEEAELSVMTQFGMRQGAQNVSAAVEQSRFRDRSGRSQTPQPTQRTQTPAQSEIKVASDVRLNSLLVTGTIVQHDLVQSILDAIDTDETPDGGAPRRRGSYLNVYQLKSADATEVTKTLTAMNIPGVTVINEEGRAGRIHIMATERKHEEVAELIRQLDGGGGSEAVSVIQLHSMDPLSAAATLRSLFYADGDAAPTIETDLYGRRLIIRGSQDHITQIKTVLAELGETGGPRVRMGGTVRNRALQGRDPEQFLRILKQQWDASEVPLKVLVLEEQSPVESRQTSDGELPTGPTEAGPSDAQPPGRNNLRSAPEADDDGESKEPDVTSRRSVDPARRHIEWQAPKQTIPVRFTPKNGQAADESTAAGAGPENGGPPATQQRNRNQQPPRPGVEVIVRGDELILSGRDEAELDRLEDLFDYLQQTVPFKPRYTQFFLKSADALEASDMLSQLMPSSSVATTSAATGGGMLDAITGGFGNLGSSLMDATGLSGLGASTNSLTIVPDIRTNSLFLQGPPVMVKDAISLLKVLDSNDGPESLKDMQARSIAVKYADVREVKPMLDDLFKTYLQAQQQGRGQQANPLAAMFGGGGGGGNGRGGGGSAVRMTLAVDEQNSLILVNSSQELFDEVESVVAELDETARQANRLIKVIQLKNADASLIQQSLTNLMPRVTVSSSRTGSSRTSSSSGNTPGASSQGSSSSQQDAINRAIQDRIRQRFQGGGGGGSTSPFGGGRGTGGSTRGGFGGFGGRGSGGGGFRGF